MFKRVAELEKKIERMKENHKKDYKALRERIVELEKEVERLSNKKEV